LLQTQSRRENAAEKVFRRCHNPAFIDDKAYRVETDNAMRIKLMPEPTSATNVVACHFGRP
jgi:hypothetical protein